jgi:Lipocalin-like domain
MKNFFLPLCSVLALSLTFTGCKKDKDDPAPTTSKAEILTQSGRKWKITADVTEVKVGAAATVTTDEFANYAACEKDDYLIFRSDKSLTADPGTIKCSPSDAAETGVWDFNSDQTRLTVGVSGSALTLQADIVQLDNSTLKLRTTDNSTPGTVETNTITYSSF